VIHFHDSVAEAGLESVDGFFDGWPNPPSPSTFIRILENSSEVVLACERTTLIGFITAVSDGVLAAYIPLLEVQPMYRAQGIGSELVRRMLAKLDGLYMVDVSCDDDVVPFYERLGFSRSGASMIRRNYQAQSGRLR
jgi:ribosomal protein S18 acetylase RimI-like enzyme